MSITCTSTSRIRWSSGADATCHRCFRATASPSNRRHGRCIDFPAAKCGRMSEYPRVASLKTAAAFRAHLERSSIALDFDDRLDPPELSPLGQPVDVDGVRVGNRFCILPMEGWDGTKD